MSTKRNAILAGTAAGILLVGLGVGNATAGNNVKETPEYQSLQSENDSLESQVTTLESQVQGFESRASEFASKEAALTQREQAVSDRESAVTVQETAAADGTLSPGTYLVPEEVSPGRYRTVNDVTGTCYMKQAKGDDIIDNMLEENGRPVFTVQNVPGTTLVIDSECGSVRKI